MTWRIWLELIIVLVFTNFITWVIAWRRGIRNAEKWEKYRRETGAKIDNMPYSDMFRKNELLNPNKPPPLIVRHVRKRVNGKWSED